jgi:hypothetical protein
MAYDAARQVIVLYLAGDIAKTWEWDGVTWTLKGTDGPPNLFVTTMAYDSLRHRVIMSGYGTTWAWDGNTWTLVAAPGSPVAGAGDLAGVTYDTVRDVLLVSEGADFWQVTFEPAIISQPGPQNVRLGETGSFAVTAAGAGSDFFTYQWYHGGTALSDNGRISGAQAAMLTIDAVNSSDQGEYYVTVTGENCPNTSATATLTIACLGDLDGNGMVDLVDLTTLLSHYGQTGTSADGDLDGDGQITLTDLAALLVGFGTSCN